MAPERPNQLCFRANNIAEIDITHSRKCSVRAWRHINGSGMHLRMASLPRSIGYLVSPYLLSFHPSFFHFFSTPFDTADFARKQSNTLSVRPSISPLRCLCECEVRWGSKRVAEAALFSSGCSSHCRHSCARARSSLLSSSSSFGLTILCDAICLKRNQMKRSINHSGERTDATGERTWKSRKRERENRLSRYKSRRSKRNGDGERERERGSSRQSGKAPKLTTQEERERERTILCISPSLCLSDGR